MLEKVFYFILYLVTFALLYVALPPVLFSGTKDTEHPVFFSNFIRMSLLVIITGYILAFLKIFELVAVLFVFGLVIYRNKRRISKLSNQGESFSDEIYYWIYDYTDGLIHLPGLIKTKIKNRWRRIKSKLVSFDQSDVIHAVNMIFVFVYSGVLRFVDIFENAAPAMSDAYVTLAWIKYIGKNRLFRDGIYPHGYHIHMSILQKIASLDPLVILKFSGPVTSMLIIYALYFFTSKLLKCRTSGLVAASVYGIFGYCLTASIERQVATNSQEYGFIFILPCLYFTYQYLKSNNKKDLYIAGAALTVTGLIHTLSFAFTVLWIAMVFVSFLITCPKETVKKIKALFVTGVISSTVMMLPILIGLAFGKEFHGASLDFATGVSQGGSIPRMILTDYLVFASLAIEVLHIVFRLLTDKRVKDSHDLTDITGLVFMCLLGFSAVFIYFLGGTVTKSLVMATRTGEVYALIAPVIIACGFYGLFRFLLYPLGTSKKTVLSGIGLAGALGLTLMLSPEPVIPYKMEYNSYVEQYYRIKKEIRATEWLVVSQEEGYAVCLGKGWHLMAKDFLEGYDPKNLFSGSADPESEMPVPNVFIFIEEEPYETYRTTDILEEAYRRRVKESALLKKWVEEYQRANGDAILYYQDEHLTVYRINKPSTEDRRE